MYIIWGTCIFPSSLCLPELVFFGDFLQSQVP